jgi:hypothetical protein
MPTNVTIPERELYVRGERIENVPFDVRIRRTSRVATFELSMWDYPNPGSIAVGDSFEARLGWVDGPTETAMSGLVTRTRTSIEPEQSYEVRGESYAAHRLQQRIDREWEHATPERILDDVSREVSVRTDAATDYSPIDFAAHGIAHDELRRLPHEWAIDNNALIYDGYQAREVDSVERFNGRTFVGAFDPAVRIGARIRDQRITTYAYESSTRFGEHRTVGTVEPRA